MNRLNCEGTVGDDHVTESLEAGEAVVRINGRVVNEAFEAAIDRLATAMGTRPREIAPQPRSGWRGTQGSNGKRTRRGASIMREAR